MATATRSSAIPLGLPTKIRPRPTRVLIETGGWRRAGEAPGSSSAIRARRAPARIRNWKGGSQVLASPSTATAVPGNPSTTTLGEVHCRQPSKRSGRPAISVATSRFTSEALWTESVVTPRLPPSRQGRDPKPAMLVSR